MATGLRSGLLTGSSVLSLAATSIGTGSSTITKAIVKYSVAPCPNPESADSPK